MATLIAPRLDRSPAAAAAPMLNWGWSSTVPRQWHPATPKRRKCKPSASDALVAKAQDAPRDRAMQHGRSGGQAYLSVVSLFCGSVQRRHTCESTSRTPSWRKCKVLCKVCRDAGGCGEHVRAERFEWAHAAMSELATRFGEFVYRRLACHTWYVSAHGCRGCCTHHVEGGVAGGIRCTLNAEVVSSSCERSPALLDLIGRHSDGWMSLFLASVFDRIENGEGMTAERIEDAHVANTFVCKKHITEYRIHTAVMVVSGTSCRPWSRTNRSLLYRGETHSDCKAVMEWARLRFAAEHHPRECGDCVWGDDEPAAAVRGCDGLPHGNRQELAGMAAEHRTEHERLANS